MKNFSDYKNIKTYRTEYDRVGSKWVVSNKQRYLMSERQYKNFTDPSWTRHNRYLGGFERAEKDYTSRGYRTIRNTSISPDRDKKIVVSFDFDGSEKLYNRSLNYYYKRK